jgi:hypothetical protein
MFKMRRYNEGGRVSDRQWSDILGIATRRDLDWDYIAGWAAKLGVADLRARLRSEIA